jgi:asparagine synthase (glutamine-hydrolysing)
MPTDIERCVKDAEAVTHGTNDSAWRRRYPRRMCGIAGIVGGPPPDKTLLGRMAETMWKRGPDGQGVWGDDRAGLSVRRLAIIDLHERSNQPLHFGALHLVFNGEIYNYKELRDELHVLGHSFETEGDAEVLLHAWAEWRAGALDRVNGMFAFAVWDEAEQLLTLACDPFGEKPLYYAQKDGRLIFASEVKALLLDPTVDRAANESALGGFLARAVMPEGPATFFRGISRLPGAHLLRWRRGRVETERYWHPQPVEVPDNYEVAVAELRDLLLDSIRLRLRSDVPVGTSLSGGVDSSTIVALSAELAGDHRRHAFTARFPGFERDEWRYAHEVAERAHVIEHHSVEPTAEGALNDLRQLVLDHEEPFGSLSIYAQWRVMAAARAAGVIVLLDGQGGDELFGGYKISAGFAIRSGGPRFALAELLASPRSTAVVGRSLAIDVLPKFAKQEYWRRAGTPYASADVAAQAASDGCPDRPAWIRGANPLGRELRTQAFASILPELLRYGDRSSMAHSVELRLPLLDRRLAEFAFSAPPEFLYRNGKTKRILRDAGRGLVPDAILERRDKVAYEPPQSSWLSEPAFRERIADVLLGSEARSRGLYDAAAIEADARNGSWRDPRGIWRALNAELWLRTLVEGPRPDVEQRGQRLTSSISSA